MRVLFRFDRTDHWYKTPSEVQSAGDGRPARILKLASRYGGPPDEMIQQAAGDEERQRELATRYPYRYHQTFNDWAYYCHLQSQDGVVTTSVKSVLVLHSPRYIMGLQTTYECAMADGSTEEFKTVLHRYNNGWYSYSGGRMEQSILELEEGEYIVSVQTRQGEILDQLQFVTNTRTVLFGGNGGSGEPETSVDTSFRVVAFAGLEYGVMKRVGYYAESYNWAILKSYILARELVEMKRASPLNPRLRGSKRHKTDEGSFMVQAVISETRDDIFKHILSYLVRAASDL